MDKEWMTEDVAAEWLGVSTKDLRGAISRGELPMLRIGSQLRLSRSALIARSGGPAGILPGTDHTPADNRAARNGHGGLPAPAGLEWRQALTAAKPFEHRWPALGGFSLEKYPRAWSGTVALGGAQLDVLVGEATGAERNDGKPRLTVLFDNYPIAEFVPTADRKGWASLIKPDGRHSVAPGSPLPRLYLAARIQPYHVATGLSGRGRPSGVAVVIARDDITSAVHHAAARWMGRNGQPVEPPS
jgi:excisionase family DNA binding protein